MAVFAYRVAAAGCGAPRRLAHTIFAVPEQNAPLGVCTLLDDLTQPQ
jgi:hypothetical protein